MYSRQILHTDFSHNLYTIAKCLISLRVIEALNHACLLGICALTCDDIYLVIQYTLYCKCRNIGGTFNLAIEDIIAKLKTTTILAHAQHH